MHFVIHPYHYNKPSFVNKNTPPCVAPIVDYEIVFRSSQSSLPVLDFQGEYLPIPLRVDHGRELSTNFSATFPHGPLGFSPLVGSLVFSTGCWPFRLGILSKLCW